MNQIDIFELTLEQFKFTHRPIRLFEAFAGIGCQAMALKQLGIEYEVVGISEIDKYAIASYHAIHDGEYDSLDNLDKIFQKNKLTKNYGDISKMEKIPECDIFTWSFPCTDLSKAGKRKGMTEDTRSGLVYEVLRLLQATKDKPQVLIMENVPDLVQANFARQWADIQYEIECMGYSNYTQRLNAKDYGVAQNRDRVFMVSIMGKYSYKFPERVKLEKRLKDYLENDVDEKYYLSEKQLKGMQETKFESMGVDRIKNIEDETINTISTMQGGNREPKIAYALGSREFASRGWMDQCPTLTARDYKDPKVVAEPICLNSKVNGKQPSIQDRIYDTEGTSTAITTAYMPSIAIPEATKQGYAEASEGDGVYINRPHQKRGVVQKGMIQTLKTSGDDIGVVIQQLPRGYNEGNEFDKCPTITSNSWEHNNFLKQDLRIRKLTPRECWRLMGISNEDFEKASQVVSNSQLYKQAGNGIVVDVFREILRGLL